MVMNCPLFNSISPMTSLSTWPLYTPPSESLRIGTNSQEFEVLDESLSNPHTNLLKVANLSSLLELDLRDGA